MDGRASAVDGDIRLWGQQMTRWFHGSVTTGSLARPLTPRFEYRISAGGRYGVCLASDNERGLHLETWARSADEGWRPGHTLGPAYHPQMLPTDDGRVFVYDSLDDDSAIWLFDPAGNRARLATHSMGTGLRLFACPRPGRPGLAIVYDDDHSEIWRLQDHQPALVERLARIPGVLMTGLRLDAPGDLLAIERAAVATGPTEIVVIDLRDGSWSTLLNVHEHSYDSLLLTDPATGLLMVGTDVSGVRRIGWTRISQPGSIRFPETLNSGEEPVQPLAPSPSGRQVLLHRTIGVRSQLSIFTPEQDRVTELAVPAGRVHGAARWTRDGLTFVFSAPTHPQRPITVTASRASEHVIELPTQWPETLAEDSRDKSPVHVERLPGATGPIETIIYGGPQWRDNNQLLIALHGGPLSAWRYEFSPFLQRLADTGVSIVAPNLRGSTGYGSHHALAINGAWGVPDLDDVLRIASDIRWHRVDHGLSPLRLFGESYGAFLALLAVSCFPRLWSRCAVLAPFLSGQRLYADAGPGVRGLLDRLGGRVEIRDKIGPRDVLRLCAYIQAKLLIVHGTLDTMIPVAQSRTLRRRLLHLGWQEGRDLRYLEIAKGTHELLTDPYGGVATATLEFLTGVESNSLTSAR